METKSVNDQIKSPLSEHISGSGNKLRKPASHVHLDKHKYATTEPLAHVERIKKGNKPQRENVDMVKVHRAPDQLGKVQHIPEVGKVQHDPKSVTIVEVEKHTNGDTDTTLRNKRGDDTGTNKTADVAAVKRSGVERHGSCANNGSEGGVGQRNAAVFNEPANEITTASPQDIL